jgi:hypothetical protein
MRHARGDETLMKGGPDATPVELEGNGRYRLIFVGNDKPCDAVLDDFRHRSTPEGDDGVPQAMASIITRPNGSGQSMGKSKAAAFCKKLSFLVSSTSLTSLVREAFIGEQRGASGRRVLLLPIQPQGSGNCRHELGASHTEFPLAKRVT